MPGTPRWLAAGWLLLAACAGPSRNFKAELNQKMARRDWLGAQQAIEQKRELEYGPKNAVLFHLDQGAVLHHAGRFQESDAALDQAEQRMEELFTQSITKKAGTFLLNDNADDYRGDPHERAVLHILRALNHAYQARRDEAVVEARKVSAFLAELSDRTGGKLSYRDDAFAQYLAGLLFEDAGRRDDARISYETSRKVYAESYAQAFGTPAPLLEPAMGAPAEGEVVFLHYNGVAPRRESHTIQVAWNQVVPLVQASDEAKGNPQVQNALVAGIAGNAITVAFPAFVQDPYQVRGSLVEAGGVQVRTILVEDVSAIARKALEDQIALVWAKAVTRAAIKYIVAKAGEEQTKKRAGAALGKLAGVVGQAGAAGTEVADTRCWATIPSQFRMARLLLPAGRHDLKVSYLDQAGGVLWAEAIPVDVSRGQRSYVHVRTAF